MKKYIYLLALCAILPLAVSCKSAPKAQEADITSPEEQAPAETAAEQAPEPDTAASEIPADTDAAIIDDASAVTAPQNPPEMEASAALIEPDPALTEAETPPPAEVIAVSLPEPVPPPSQPENIPPQTAQTPPAETAPAQPPAAPDIVAQTQPPAAAPESVTQTPPPAQESPAEESPAQEETAAEPPRQIPALPETAPSPVPLTNAIDEQIVLSRIVRVTVGQLLEIPFRGTGWVYLGETSSLRGIAYNSRRIDPEGQSFVFRVEAPGTYTLKFFKQDFVRDFALNDYVQVIAGEAPEAAGSGWFSP
ncbi:MAG TPA: hypothetical protein DEQ14_11155, partial [Treponema sp.]|nr:hypothetical protein [Treponema sp.]